MKTLDLNNVEQANTGEAMNLWERNETITHHKDGKGYSKETVIHFKWPCYVIAMAILYVAYKVIS